MLKLTSQSEKSWSLTWVDALLCFSVHASAEIEAVWGQDWSGLEH